MNITMKKSILTGFLLIIFSCLGYGQINHKYGPSATNPADISVFNPFTSGVEEQNSSGLAWEYGAYTLAYAGGSLASGGLFLVGFMLAWGGSPAAYPFIIASGISAIMTPYVAGRALYAAGRKYHPEGTRKAAIWGSYLGTIFIGGTAYLITVFNQGESQALNVSMTVASLLLPGVAAVAIFNNYPKRTTNNNALFNINNGKAGFGFPNISLSTNRLMPDTRFTQISLARITF